VNDLAAFVWSAVVIALAPSFAAAQAVPLVVENAWASNVPGSDTAAVYLTLRNTGAQPVVVVGVRSPIANQVMMHETSIVGGQSQMRPYDRLVLAPGQALTFAPGGLHIMLSGLKHGIAPGDKVPLILALASGATVTIAAAVRPLGAQ
jgi:copper(I)-binding protein